MTEQIHAGATWLKSSYSGTSGNGNCVEVALAPGSVGVRDTKSPVGTLAFPGPAWRAFLTTQRGS
jgi:hypothetical protein